MGRGWGGGKYVDYVERKSGWEGGGGKYVVYMESGNGWKGGGEGACRLCGMEKWMEGGGGGM